MVVTSYVFFFDCDILTYFDHTFSGGAVLQDPAVEAAWREELKKYSESQACRRKFGGAASWSHRGHDQVRNEADLFCCVQH